MWFSISMWIFFYPWKFEGKKQYWKLEPLSRTTRLISELCIIYWNHRLQWLPMKWFSPIYFQTLSSLALVFALHHYKPTPLYVMDEIDAALGTSHNPKKTIFALKFSSHSSSSCHILHSKLLYLFRFQERFHCGTLREGPDKGCPVHNYKVCQPTLKPAASTSPDPDTLLRCWFCCGFSLKQSAASETICLS